MKTEPTPYPPEDPIHMDYYTWEPKHTVMLTVSLAGFCIAWLLIVSIIQGRQVDQINRLENNVDRVEFTQLSATTTSAVGLIPPLVLDPNCQEDDPCWNPATMGDGQGYICYLWADGSIHAYHDTDYAIGQRTSC